MSTCFCFLDSLYKNNEGKCKIILDLIDFKMFFLVVKKCFIRILYENNVEKMPVAEPGIQDSRIFVLV